MSTATAALPAEHAPRGRAIRFAIALGGLALAGGLALLARGLRPAPALPIYGHVPAFHLSDQRGAPYDDRAMLGHVSVVDFIFTRCTSSCPRLTARMAELEDRLAKSDPGVRFVSFSVDPENDTPPVLSAYAANAHADASRWTFVTGPVDDVVRAVQDGFKMSAVKIARGAGDYDVTHGDWFIVVDAAGDVRGYYPTELAPDVDKLVDDVTRLDRQRR